jgi:hypothetical protein
MYGVPDITAKTDCSYYGTKVFQFAFYSSSQGRIYTGRIYSSSQGRIANVPPTPQRILTADELKQIAAIKFNEGVPITEGGPDQQKMATRSRTTLLLLGDRIGLVGTRPGSWS